jgi:hypothetical protein
MASQLVCDITRRSPSLPQLFDSITYRATCVCAALPLIRSRSQSLDLPPPNSLYGQIASRKLWHEFALVIPVGHDSPWLLTLLFAGLLVSWRLLCPCHSNSPKTGSASLASTILNASP